MPTSPIFVPIIEEPEREESIIKDKVKKPSVKKEKKRKEKSLLTPKQQEELQEKKEKLKEIKERLPAIEAMVANAHSLTLSQPIKDFVFDISGNPILMKIARKVFKKKKTSLNLADYRMLLENIKQEQKAQIDSFKKEHI